MALLPETDWVDRSADSALMRRHGWAERGPESLQSLAGDLGVSRERVRQLMKKARSTRPGHPVVMPALMRAIDLLSRHTPIKVDDAARLLSDAGISNRPFSAEGVISAAEFCRAESSLSIKEVKGQKFLVSEIRDEPIKLIVSTATKQARASGVSTVAEVCAEVSENRPTSEETVFKVLKSVDKIEFLEDSWFWVSEVRGAGSSRSQGRCFPSRDRFSCLRLERASREKSDSTTARTWWTNCWCLPRASCGSFLSLIPALRLTPSQTYFQPISLSTAPN